MTDKSKDSQTKSKHIAKAIGIDLGTTFSAVSIMEGGKPTVIVSSEGERTTPSVVTIRDDERIVGRVAKNQAIVNPDNTVRSIKRLMGSDQKVTIDGKHFTPQEISAMILQKLKRDAEAYLGHKVTDAVITVPAYFNDAQRTATRDAGQIAGLKVLRIINEPTAAALAYGLDKTNDHTILVFDFGGGTFDVSILELGEGVFEVKSTSGNNHLGGDDIDDAIIKYLNDSFVKQQGIDLLKDKTAYQRLKDAAEKAKIELSSAAKASINLPFITADDNGPKHLNVDLTRAKFEEISDPIFQKLIPPVKQALKDAKMQSGDIDKVIFVGGSTRIPKVQQIVKEIIGKDGDKSVNPDEAVAIGAGIQAGIIAGEIKDILLLDVTPLTLGIETLGGVRTPIIDRNTTMPTKKSQVFSTAADNQTSVTIHILQGERPMASDCKSLGKFDLVGIPPAPRGIPQVEVTFDIDANGIVNVSAQDKATGKQQSIVISGSSNLTKDEIGRMQSEASENESDDRKKMESIETINMADGFIYQTEKMFKDLGDKIDTEATKPVMEGIEELKTLLADRNIEAIKPKMEKLQQQVQAISIKLYEKAQAESGNKSGNPPDDNVVDADYEVKDEKK